MASLMGVGTTLSANGDNSAFVAAIDIRDVNFSGATRTSVSTAHMGTTGAESFAFSKFFDYGTITVNYIADVETANGVLPNMDAAAENWTLGSLGGSNDTLTFSGAVVGWTLDDPVDDLIAGSFDIKINGAITHNVT